MLSKSSKYALKGVIFLAQNEHKDRKIGVKEIAKAIEVPVSFLAKLFQELARKKVISSSKGPKGGFYLTEKDKSQKLLVVVEHLDGLSKFKECALGLKECNGSKPCPIHNELQPLRKAFLNELRTHSIEHFAQQVEEGKTFLSI